MSITIEADVAMLRWPAEDDRRRVLRERGQPRLLLVQADAPAPVVGDPDEDWVRLPAADADLKARLEGLTLRVVHARPAPELDDDGLLRRGSGWVSLPPVEARLAASLLDRFGLVVSREALSRSGWPKGAPGRNALDVHVLRLRRRIRALDLVIRTVRSRGYLLEPVPSGERSRSGSGAEPVTPGPRA